jgi:glycosyltransferase involved in cell wall biosynthesis
MAAWEAMACGLPGVSFDLPALRTYYPKGMLKTPCYDLKAFAENILKLLNDEIL